MNWMEANRELMKPDEPADPFAFLSMQPKQIVANLDTTRAMLLGSDDVANDVTRQFSKKLSEMMNHTVIWGSTITGSRNTNGRIEVYAGQWVDAPYKSYSTAYAKARASVLAERAKAKEIGQRIINAWRVLMGRASINEWRWDDGDDE